MTISDIEKKIVFGKTAVLSTDTPTDDFLDVLQIGIVNYSAIVSCCTMPSDGSSLGRTDTIDTIFRGKEATLPAQARAIAANSTEIENSVRIGEFAAFADKMDTKRDLSAQEKETLENIFKQAINKAFSLKLLTHIISLIVGVVGGLIVAGMTSP